MHALLKTNIRGSDYFEYIMFRCMVMAYDQTIQGDEPYDQSKNAFLCALQKELEPSSYVKVAGAMKSYALSPKGTEDIKAKLEKVGLGMQESLAALNEASMDNLIRKYNLPSLGKIAGSFEIAFQ